MEQLLPVTPVTAVMARTLPVTPVTIVMEQLLPVTPVTVVMEQLLPVTPVTAVMEQLHPVTPDTAVITRTLPVTPVTAVMARTLLVSMLALLTLLAGAAADANARAALGGWWRPSPPALPLAPDHGPPKGMEPLSTAGDFCTTICSIPMRIW